MISFKASTELREPPLQRALRTYVVSPLNEKYLTIALRVIWNSREEYSTMWEQRLLLEDVLKSINQVVFFIDCITAMRGQTIGCGFAFWISYDSSEFTAEAFENYVTKKILETGFNIDHCKRAKTRGMFVFMFN